MAAVAASSPFAAVAASSPFAEVEALLAKPSGQASDAQAAAGDLPPPLLARVQLIDSERLPCWIKAEAVKEDQSFEAAQLDARSVFDKIFKPETYPQLPVTMKSYADLWSLNPDGVGQAEFITRVKILIIFQLHRLQANLDLQAIITAINKAIIYCAPFTPDTDTLVWIAKLKTSVPQIEASAKALLHDNVASLAATKSQLAALAEKIEVAYTNMKKALDIIAQRLEAAESSTISTVAFAVGRAITTRTLGSPTPCLDGFRDRQKLALGIVDPNGDPEIEKNNQKIVDKMLEELNNPHLNKLGSVAPKAASAATSSPEAPDNKDN